MNASTKNTLRIILLVFAVAIIPLGVFLSKQKQEIRKGATGNNNPGQITLSPSTAVYTPGQSLPVDIVFNTGGVFMSGVAVNLTFSDSSDFAVSEIEKKADLFCSVFKQKTENGKRRMGIACFANGEGVAFSEDTVLGSFTITPGSSATGSFSVEFLTEETKMEKKNNNGDIIDILANLPSPAGVYSDQASSTSSPPATNSPTQPPETTTAPTTSPTEAATPPEGSSCSPAVSFSTDSDIGYLAANPDKTLQTFIADTSGTVDSAELYLSSWNNSPRKVTLWIKGIEADNQATVNKGSGSWHQFNFSNTKPEIIADNSFSVEVQQDANWNTATAWNRDSQGQTLKLNVNCLDSPSVTPATTLTPTSPPPTITQTPTTVHNPPTATPKLPEATLTPSVTPGVPVCSTQLPASQCTCDVLTACGAIMRQRGDFNCSGGIDLTDFSQWVVGFVYNNSPKDMNCDGQANISDFNTWLTNYINNP